MMKRIIALLLAFQMVVSILPVSTFADEIPETPTEAVTEPATEPSTEPTEPSTEPSTEPVCATCGANGCTSEHLTWCPECKKDDCGQNHCDTCGTIDCTTEHKICDKCGTLDCTADHTNWCADCKVDNCGQNHCPTCGTIDCAKEHKPCETCAVIDCTADHTNWCPDCRKDNCGVDHSAPKACETCGRTDCEGTHENWCPECGKDNCGVDHSAPKACETCGSTDCDSNHENWCPECGKDNCGVDHSAPKACETCGSTDCEGNHENWCPDCRKDNCGKKHVYCKICKKNDCGVDHTAKKPGITKNSPATISTEDHSADVGKYVALKDGISEIRIFYGPGESSLIPDDFKTGTIMKITAWKVDTAGLWYQLEFYKGGFVESSFTKDIPSDAWFLQENGTFAFLETCADCGKPDCDIEHDDAADGELEATVTDKDGNVRTITVTGDSLPEGATLEVTPIENEADILADLEMEGGFIWDIKVYDKDGNEWQPTSGQTVKLSIPVPNVPDGKYITVEHCLDTVSSIDAAIASNKAYVMDISEEPSAIKVMLAPAVSAWQQTFGSAEEKIMFSRFSGLCASNGAISINIDGFSIFSWNGSFQDTRFDDDPGTGSGDTRIVVCKGNDDNSSGKTFYAHRNQYIVFDTGMLGTAKSNWKIETERGTSHSFSSTSSYYAQLTISSTAALGTKIKVSFNGNGNNRKGEVWIVVIEDRPVNYYSNDGSGKITTVNAITDGYGTDQKAKAPSISRTGYNFLGWYDSDSGGNRLGGADLSIMPTSTSGQNVYAQWDPIKYTVQFHANGGSNTVTGSMPPLDMTYDVETTLPRNKFVNQADGYVFLGWATSANGNVVYSDGAKISNLTATDGATVTLYAKWKYGLDSTIYIGINNTYHNPKGKYTAGGVTIDSYHTYPNEPAQMIGDFDRVTDDKGAWRYDSASAVPLKYKAENYIAGNIFNSPDYKMTYVEGENTLGIADPTGSAVRSMLKFTEDDYNAMIAVWLTGMRNTLISYGDSNFDWENAKASDFTIVPYVIKFQHYDSWYIDMVVVPKALYTLAYDGNIENGYTAAFDGVAFPPSSQYTDGSTVNVVGTPIGYQNNNMKVTKVVDGHTYTATFQYWYDDKGNTYGGTTGNNTIKLTEDTILYAKWEYPDASFGNLNITKTVVDKDAHSNPDSAQEFTFTFTTSAPEKYEYTIYDKSAKVQVSGKFIVNNGTFTLEDGWRIRIMDLPKGASYSVTETDVDYYTNATGVVTGTINAGATTYATVTNNYRKYADYTVKHYLLDTVKNQYIEQTADAETRYGVVGSKTEAVARTYDGYNAKSITQVTINKNGTTVVQVFYDPTYTVTGTIDEGGNVTNGNQTVTHGDKSREMVFTPKTGYEISSITVKKGTGEETVTVTEEYKAGYTYEAQENVTAPITVTVTTTLKKYPVTGSIDEGGNVTNGNQTVTHGDNSAEMVFTPKTGYVISSITVQKGSSKETVTVTEAYKARYTYEAQENVTGPITVTVTTTLKKYPVTGTIDDGGSVTNGNQTVTHGDNSAVMVFTPEDGYEISTITVTKGTSVDNVTVTDAMKAGYTYEAQENVTGPITVTVTTSPVEKTVIISYEIKTKFSPAEGEKTASLTVSSEEIQVNQGEPEGSTIHDFGENFEFVGWYDNAELNGDPISTDKHYIPEKPADGIWKAATFYAKINRKTAYIYYRIDGIEMPEGKQYNLLYNYEETQFQGGHGCLEGSSLFLKIDIPSLPWEFLGWYDAEGNLMQEGEINIGTLENPYMIPVPDVTPDCITPNGWPAVSNYYARYQEKTVTFNYVAVGPEGAEDFAVLSATKQENVSVFADDVASTATAAQAYKFVGWYADPECTELITTDATISPEKDASYDIPLVDSDETHTVSFFDFTKSPKTYYAKFEYNLTSLTIQKSGASTSDANQSFIFNIKGNGVDMDVVVHGNGSVTIDGLTVGAEYTITEKTDWSWRYVPGNNGRKVTLGLDDTITFTNNRSETKWLNGAAWCDNRFTRTN